MYVAYERVPGTHVGFCAVRVEAVVALFFFFFLHHRFLFDFTVLEGFPNCPPAGPALDFLGGGAEHAPRLLGAAIPRWAWVLVGRV